MVCKMKAAVESRNFLTRRVRASKTLSSQVTPIRTIVARP